MIKGISSKLSSKFSSHPPAGGSSKFSLKEFLYIPLKFLLALAVIIAFIFLVFRPKSTQAVWWDDSWGFRKAITVTVPSNSSDMTNLETLENKSYEKL